MRRGTMPNDGSEFLGVPEDVLVALGKGVVAAARLEHAALEIAVVRGEDAGNIVKQPCSEVARRIRKRAGDRLPGDARVDASGVTAWRDEVGRAVNEGKEILH